LSSNEENNLELVARIRVGDALAEEQFVAAYQQSLLLITAARTRDREAARDLTQDILIAVLRGLRDGQLREADKLDAFVHGTARNLINNYLRSKIRRRESDLSSTAEPAVEPIPQLELTEKQRLIRSELESYGSLDQQILLLSLVDGHSLLEIADRLEISHEAVRQRRSRMVRKLTKKFSRLSQT
jgi:RNA polymerase sigma factor (sigma-70 family)